LSQNKISKNCFDQATHHPSSCKKKKSKDWAASSKVTVKPGKNLEIFFQSITFFSLRIPSQISQLFLNYNYCNGFDRDIHLKISGPVCILDGLHNV
jgi:hypothetical protein